MASKTSGQGPFGWRISSAGAESIVTVIGVLLNQSAKAREAGLWRGLKGDPDQDCGRWDNTHAVFALAQVMTRKQFNGCILRVAEDAPDEASAQFRIARLERGRRERLSRNKLSVVAQAEILELWYQMRGIPDFWPTAHGFGCVWGYPVWESSLSKMILAEGWVIPSVVERLLPKGIEGCCFAYTSTKAIGSAAYDQRAWLVRVLKDDYPLLYAAMYMPPEVERQAAKREVAAERRAHRKKG